MYDNRANDEGERHKTAEVAEKAAKPCPALYQDCREAFAKICSEPELAASIETGHRPETAFSLRAAAEPRALRPRRNSLAQRVHEHVENRYRTALIVGAGSGLSAALARALSGAGLKVALAARTPDKLAPSRRRPAPRRLL